MLCTVWFYFVRHSGKDKNYKENIYGYQGLGQGKWKQEGHLRLVAVFCILTVLVFIKSASAHRTAHQNKLILLHVPRTCGVARCSAYHITLSVHVERTTSISAIASHHVKGRKEKKREVEKKRRKKKNHALLPNAWSWILYLSFLLCVPKKCCMSVYLTPSCWEVKYSLVTGRTELDYWEPS